MDEETSNETVAERMFCALVAQLIRAGKMDPEDVHAAADALDAAHDDEAAHALRCIPLHAAAMSPAEFQAKQRRDRMFIVPDGGKRGD